MCCPVSLPYFSKITKEFKSSINLAVPMIITEVIYSLTGFVATMMVAHLGKTQLAANALASSIYLTLILFFIGILCAVSIMVSHSFGAKDNNGVSICFKQGLILAILCSLPMMLIMWFSPMVLAWTGQNATVIHYAKPLFHTFIWCMLPINIVVVMEQFLIGITRARIVTISVTLSVPLQLLLYYIFIFGKFGCPKFGIAGIGYGNLAEHLIVAIYFICYIHTSKSLHIYNLFSKWWHINKKFLLEMIRIGSPLGAIFCLELALFAAISIMMGKIDTNNLAAYQIAYQFMMLPLVIIFALTQTTSVRIGNEVGNNNRDALKLVMLVNMAISIMFVIGFSIIYINFPYLVISLDININSQQFAQVAKIAASFLAMVGILIFSDCFRLISFGALRGLKDTKFPLFASSILCFWGITFPTAYLLAFKYKLGGIGIWWGMLIGFTMAGILMFFRFNYLTKHADLTSLVTKS